MSDDVEQCGHETADGTECQLPPSQTDGRCHHHTDTTKVDSGGRPSKFTDERARQAIAAAELGKSIAGCGRDAGVSKETVRVWRDTEGIYFEGPDGNQYDFFAAFRRARGTGETYYIREGRRAEGEVDPSFAKFMLASSYDYKKTEKKEMEDVTEGEGGFGSVTILDSEYATDN